MIRVALTGALGRMGRAMHDGLASTGEFEFPLLLDALDDTDEVYGGELKSDPELIHPGCADVLLDLTVAAVACDHVRRAIKAGIPAVVGTTGIRPDQIDELDRNLKEHGGTVLLVPNFSIGAVLMMRFAAEAARYMPAAEIIEMHHPAKIDAPSGTALATAEQMITMDPELNAARRLIHPDDRHPSRGMGKGSLKIHAVRMQGVLARQQVIFGSEGETLTIEHNSIDRSCFLSGVIMALKGVSRLRGLHVGLDSVMESSCSE